MRFVFLLVLLAVSACESSSVGGLSVEDVAIVRVNPAMPMSAGYMLIRNDGQSSVRITSIESPQFESVEMHETTQVDGIARMRRMDALTIASNESVVFERGGKHLMLMGPLSDGTTTELRFFSEGELLLSVSTTGNER